MSFSVQLVTKCTDKSRDDDVFIYRDIKAKHRFRYGKRLVEYLSFHNKSKQSFGFFSVLYILDLLYHNLNDNYDLVSKQNFYFDLQRS